VYILGFMCPPTLLTHYRKSVFQTHMRQAAVGQRMVTLLHTALWPSTPGNIAVGYIS